jgi:5-methylcytosine-specific restriction endonuclease McrBC regulatory subunit McrC
VADAKYKDYDARSLATPDLYQVTAYAYACGDVEAAPVFILYPTTHPDLVGSGELRFAGLKGRAPVRISIIGIPVTRILEDEQYNLGAALARNMGISA